MPAQPYPDRLAPNGPSSAIAGTSSSGNDPSFRTCSWITGRNSRVTHSRTVSRASRSSSESNSSRRRKSSPWKFAIAPKLTHKHEGPGGGEASGPMSRPGGRWGEEANTPFGLSALRGGGRAIRALAAPHLLHLLVDEGDL